MVQYDTLKTKDGQELKFGFMGHASLYIGFGQYVIYTDPVDTFGDYSRMPVADAILVTHHHGDHFDPATVGKLTIPETIIVGSAAVIEELGRGVEMKNGDKKDITPWMHVEALPAYNTTFGRDRFHPNTGRDNGYIITLGGTRIYAAGDSEPTPEMLALKDIDIAFLPVNQPYTMTVDQAVEVVKTIKPRIFYPYHYGMTEFVTDTDRLARMLEGSGTEVRIRPME